jgi:hypothetical protein
VAARARRSQEASIIMEMAGELCISQEKLRRIDKATIVRLAIDYIRAHAVLCNVQQQEMPLYSAPKLATASIFAPKTVDNMNEHFLMIEEKDNGKGAFVLKPDSEINEEDDLTHLAPQAGDISISLEAEPLEGIPLEDLLIPSPTMIHQQQLWMR